VGRHGYDEVLAECLTDPAFRREWERTAVARAVALWLADYRDRHGLSQEELAGRTGLRQPAIARLEAGDTEPKLSTLLRLTEALGVPLDIRLLPRAEAGDEGARVAVSAGEARAAA
jgi:transcriptional regulator with XRE-family HTH domain